MGSLFRQIGVHEFRTTEDSLDDEGYVLTFGGASTAGNMKKTASGQLTPWGIAYTSTKSPFDGTAQASVAVALIREGDCYVKLLSTNATIVAGDLLMAVAGGFVDKSTAALTTYSTDAPLLRSSVGIAMEGKNGSVGGKILTKLKIRGSI